MAKSRAPVNLEEMKAARLVRLRDGTVYLIGHLGLNRTMSLTHS